jgi:hypothetical protein
MADNDPGQSTAGAPAGSHCIACGAELHAGARFCPACGSAWRDTPFERPAEVARLLNELARLRTIGVLDAGTLATVQAHYQPLLAAAAAARTPAEPRPRGQLSRLLDPEPRAVPAAAAAVSTGGGPAAAAPRPPVQPRMTLGQWATARQADILLYLGAFLLSIAALIVVGYQGEAFTDGQRVSILTAYTAGFLVLGLLLPRWQRVREAGPVFLALGALLVPVNVLALRTRVLGADALADDMLLLLGAALSCALYSVLALRGYGRWYGVLAGVALLAGWGALSSVLNVPDRWLPTWYAGLAALASIAATLRRPAGERWYQVAVIAVATFSGLAGLLVFLDNSDEPLPMTVLLAVSAAAAAVAAPRRHPLALALLPPLAGGALLWGAWSVFGTHGSWLTPAVAVVAWGYLVLALIDRPHVRQWSDVAVLVGVLAPLIGHGTVPHDDAGWLVLTYAIVLVGSPVAARSLRRPELLGGVPLLLAGLAGSLLWAVWEPSPDWYLVVVAAATPGYLALADLDRHRESLWRVWAAVVAGCAIVTAHHVPFGAVNILSLPSGDWSGVAAVLPLVYAAAVASATWDGVRGRAAGAVMAPWLVAAGGATALWAAGVAGVWYGYPALATAVAVVLSARWWERRENIAPWGWPTAVALAALPPFLLLPATVVDGARHAAVMFGGGGAVLLWCAAAARDRDPRPAGRRAVDGEWFDRTYRFVLARVGGFYLWVAAGFLNSALGVARVDRAWAFVAIGMVEWALLAVAGRRRREALTVLAPGAVLAFVIAAALAWDDRAVSTAVLALAAFGPLAAFAGAGRWSVLVVTLGFGVVAVARLWQWREFEPAALPLAYALIGAALWGATYRRRQYLASEPDLSRLALAWTLPPVAIVTALVFVERRSVALELGAGLARTPEWLALVAATLLLAVLVTVEGVRLRLRAVVTAGSAGLLAALLLVIAVAEPANVQAYTVPAALYLIGLGLVNRRSPTIIEGQLFVHEAVMVAGAVVLVLPAAVQSFAPDGGLYGLEVIGLGAALLAAGLALAARWLVVCGVLSLSGVAVRWLLTTNAVPYWLILGVAGMMLLAIGMVLLLERERWDRARMRIDRWWGEGQ